MNQNGLARAQASRHHQVGPDSAGYLHDRGGIFQGIALWDWRELTFGHSDVFRITTTGEQGADFFAY